MHKGAAPNAICSDRSSYRETMRLREAEEISWKGKKKKKKKKKTLITFSPMS